MSVAREEVQRSGNEEEPAKEARKGRPVSPKGNKESVILGNQQKKVFPG